MTLSLFDIVTRLGRVIRSEPDLTKTLGFYVGQDVYARLLDSKTGAITTLSISRYCRDTPHVDLTQRVVDVVSAMTDIQIAAFTDTTLPTPDQYGLYKNYIKAYSPLSDPHCVISFLSLNHPDQLDVPGKETIYNDLVIKADDGRDFSNTLVAVCGVFHPTIVWEGNLYVIDGYATCRLSGRADIVCYDTTAVGGHICVPITEDILTMGDTQNAGLITLPDSLSFTGKTLFAVIDGYLHHPDEITSVRSDKKAYFRPYVIQYIRQFRHNPKIKFGDTQFGSNWSWLTPDTQPDTAPPVQTGTWRSYNTDPYVNIFVNKRSVPASVLESEDFRRSRITSAHSFLILINNDALFLERHFLNATQKIGLYESTSKIAPHGISRYGCGLSPSYTWLSAPRHQNLFMLAPQDPDMDAIDHVVAPDLIPCLIDQKDKIVHRSLSLYFYYSK